MGVPNNYLKFFFSNFDFWQNASFTFINCFPILASGCDSDYAIAVCGSGWTNCNLGNGYSSGSCCSPDHQCDLGEGDCDDNEDCLGDYICGNNNCGSTFPDDHDCCTCFEEETNFCIFEGGLSFLATIQNLFLVIFFNCRIVLKATLEYKKALPSSSNA